MIILYQNKNQRYISIELLPEFFNQFSISRYLSLIHISEPTRPLYISYAVFCLKNIGLIYEKRGRYAEQNGDLDQRDIWFDKAAEVWSKAVRLYPGGYLDIENWLKNSGRSSIDMYL